MGLTIFQVDAFTDRPFAGNPAGVCVLQAFRPLDKPSQRRGVCAKSLPSTFEKPSEYVQNALDNPYN